MKIKLEIVLIILHIVIGLVISVFRPISKVYELALVLGLFVLVYFKKDKQQAVLIALAYVAGSDVFVKMSGGSISYELHKYLIIIFSVIGILAKDGITKGYQYLIYILLLFPAIFVGDYTLEDEVRKLIAFNLSGPVSLGVVAFYLYRRKITFKKINQALFYLVLPIISMGVYLNFVTTSVRDMVMGTGSNFATSGGFGPNQVASILGIGIFVMITRLVLTYKFLNLQTVINLFLLSFFAYRAVITFSRGGVLTGGIAALFFIGTMFVYARNKLKLRVLGLVIIFVVMGVGVWTFSSYQTSGMIDKRYANQDASGRTKDITTGRGQLSELEIQAFMENPILGIGPGKAKGYRLEKTGVLAASHNEITRMLAEHGILGILALIILFIAPFLLRINLRSNVFFYSFFLIWFLTINHSATRIAAPAFIYALSLIDIQYEKNTVRRQSVGE